MLMVFFKGPKLLGALVTDDWVTGGMYLMGNAICFSIWYILQASTACTLTTFIRSFYYCCGPNLSFAWFKKGKPQ
jgi:hypothetical protein